MQKAEPSSRFKPPICAKHGLVMVERFDYERINALAEHALPTGQFDCMQCLEEERAEAGEKR